MNIMSETKRNFFQVLGTLHTVFPMILIQLLLLLLHFKTTESAMNTIALPGCPESCGGIPIPYPFGIGKNCNVSNNYTSTCKKLDGPKCFMQGFDLICSTFEDGTSSPYKESSVVHWAIHNISLSLGQARIGSPLYKECYNNTTKKEEHTWYSNAISAFGDMAPFRFNTEKNKFTVTGCNTLAYFIPDSNSFNSSVGCLSSCNSLDAVIKHGSCSGIGCCQTDIPKGVSTFMFSFDERFNNSEVYQFSPCSYATVVEEAQFKFSTTYITNKDGMYDANLAMVLDWAIGNTTCEEAQTNKSSYACISSNSICSTVSGGGYLCNCSHGYEGNPYLHGGCQDLDECAIQNPCSKPGKCHNLEGSYRCSCPLGWRSNHNNPRECDLNIALVIGAGLAILFILVISSFFTSWGLQKRKIVVMRSQFFRQNGGYFLQQKLASQGIDSETKIFTEKELEMATENYSENNILGKGGFGVVYRGTLSNLKVVAIKKSIIENGNQIEQFINEIIILSQINHRNVVKLLGCCLETQVPLLVYEFVPNGTLSHLLEGQNSGYHLKWDCRLSILAEAAGAISYLHSAASFPIIHRDIKSSNILLDNNFTAKVSDFGISMSVPFDKTHVTTLVRGTIGYLDPEYFLTSQLTEKSDVYSFGVVLAEMLTGEKPICFARPEEFHNLAMYFTVAFDEGRLLEVIDPPVAGEAEAEELNIIGPLTRRCLNTKGEERPAMKEVALELEALRRMRNHQSQRGNEEIQPLFVVGNLLSSETVECTKQYSLEGHMLSSMDLPR